MPHNGVVMLVNEFPPLPVGGAERQAERLASWLATHDRNIWVVTRGAIDLPAQEERDGFTVLRIQPRGPGKIRTVSFVLGSIWTLFLLRDKYSILHAHLAFGPAFAAVLIARLLKKRVIVKLGNSGEFGDIGLSQRTLRGRIRLAVFRRWADVLIILDDAMQREALAAGFRESRLRRMNNGIDLNDFSINRSRALAKKMLGLTGKVVIIFVGRLSRQKSLPTLLNGYSSALRNSPNLQLLLVGDGPERPVLEHQVQQLDLGKYVIFAGSQDDVRPYLEAADIFALPSVSEGISNALLEAMSFGLACVATPVGGNMEVLDNGKVGLLVASGDEQAWAKALEKLGNDLELRESLGLASQRRIQERFDFSVVGQQYKNLYVMLENQ
jgi:glycosyltransferase involved in cell wall biosynthesis